MRGVLIHTLNSLFVVCFAILFAAKLFTRGIFLIALMHSLGRSITYACDYSRLKYD